MTEQRKPGLYEREFVAFSANNHAVSVNLRDPDSHAATHLEKHRLSGFWSIAQLAVRHVSITQPDQAVQIEMGRPVGLMDLARVRPDEEVFYFNRQNRGGKWYPGIWRTATERTQATSVVVVTREISRQEVLNQNPHVNLFGPGLSEAPQSDLFSIYPGIKTPGLPDGDPKYLTDESRSFWREWAITVDPNEEVTIYLEGDQPGVPLAYR